MTDQGFGWQSGNRERLIRAAIQGWRDDLINLTASNRLLNFKLSKTGSVELARPGAEEVLTRLQAKGHYRFRSLVPTSDELLSAGDDSADRSLRQTPPPRTDTLDTEKDPDELGSALRALHRNSTQEFLDRGVSTLYLAFSTLTWVDEDGSTYTSPLLLVPVSLDTEAPRQLPILTRTDGDPILNPALVLMMSQRGIELPRIEDPDDLRITTVMSGVKSAVAVRNGWYVQDKLLLSRFSFAKEAMYRDLLEHEDQIAAHPAIAALATGGRGDMGDGSASFYFDEIPDQDVDRLAAPESTPVILDADSSQRATIAAALGGQSFVMDGPPGTGKSQTIANMIGALLGAGKTVLFVSEKAAALDVVRDRLDAQGLRSYLLELHSHKATRKEVAVALGTALDNVPVPPAAMPAMDVDTVRKRREQLNAYADAMNRTREPLGYSLHNVLGQVAQLHRVPAAPLAGIAPVDLTVEIFNDIKQAAEKLASAWRPAVQGRSFVWRGVTEQGSLDSSLYQAASSLQRLAGAVEVNAALIEATGLTQPSGAATVANLISLICDRPTAVPADWLTVSTLAETRDLLSVLADALAEISGRERAAAETAGVPWMAIPPSSALTAMDNGALAALIPPAVEPVELTVADMTARRTSFRVMAEMLAECRGELSSLASMLGLAAPSSFADADDLLTLADLAQTAARPERAWLSASGVSAATGALQVLRRAHQALVRAAADASVYYTPAALSSDVEGLAQRFEAGYHHLGKLSGEYRTDKKMVADFTNDGVAKELAHQHLSLAAAWKQAAAQLAATEERFGPVLGAAYCGVSTDFDQLDASVSVAANMVRRARGQDLARFADVISWDGTPNRAVTTVAAGLRIKLTDWHIAVTSGEAAGVPIELLGGSVSDAVTWLQAQLGPLGAMAAYTEGCSHAINRSLTFGQARELVTLRDAADRAHQWLISADLKYQDTFGALYGGPASNVQAITSALGWVTTLRIMMTGSDGPLSPAQAKAVDDVVPTVSLAAIADEWYRVRDAVLDAFDLDRRAELAAELDDYDDAADLIEAFKQEPGGKDEWHAYRQARTVLAGHGLDVAVEFCIAERVPAEQVALVIQRALLQEWAEYQLRADPALATVRSTDRNALVAQYQKLDQALIAAATGTIVRACNARRPRSDIGESAVIHHEAQKKRKHMPVRNLIDRTRHVTQAIKPCFMMSPLAVSQFLPADLHFDVVIFDEASQVSPNDAINCIYRGSALILSGDQKQLPPTSFFAATNSGDEEEWSEDSEDLGEFQSILDMAKASGAYRSLTLRWHYRSRHEALIAFSNTRFYKGQLVTFPSRHSDGPDVGVELIHVDGVYRRGTSRDNLIEAAKVAERVVHHYDTRLERSLGVVTFSEAQAAAIDAAITSALQHRPDLEKFFAKDDRLHGFFVKSLESVQGDERDVLIFSIGYGPDENGKITMNFGPLNKEGGWRRLNVAITRARYRNEIVTSIRPGDISESVTSEGVRQLRHYLDYAQRGMAALALDTSSGGDAESPFEESVIETIRSWGYQLVPQVGAAGFRIDIGICHPEHPGVYALGIECDGYQYHSSRVARDRDRLREGVLRGLGWSLHRIWGTAWYRDRAGEEYKLRVAIEHAVAAPVNGLLTVPGGDNERVIISTEPARFEEHPTWAFPYAVADVPLLPSWADISDPGSASAMVPAIRAVVGVEEPIHLGLLHQRLREAWNVGRVGSRIRGNIELALARAGVFRDGDFITITSPPHVTVRTPVDGCRRGIEQISNLELSLAIVSQVSDVGGISKEQLSARIAALYGWGRRGPDIAVRFDRLIDGLLVGGVLSGNQDNLTIPVPPELSPA
ncbi:MAG TPA: DUF3320 domain-containing protein [Streptosporangiaceae bacterium]